MAIYDDTVGLENFLQRALHISQHLTACHTEESFTIASPANRPLAPEPMQMERYHLTPTERARRINLGLCMYCGAHDHLLPVCPIRPTRPAVSTVQILPDVSKLPHIDALLIHMNQSFPAKVLVDSGASGNFISSLFLTQINIPRHQNATHYQITNIQGKPLGKGLVRSRTPEVTLRIGSLHSEYISFLVLEDATVDIVLGRPWLALHHPDIHWNSGEVLKWSDYCFKECLTNLPVPPQADTSAFVCSTSIESPIPQHTVQIPTEYQAFQDVFSKSAATRLPPPPHGTALSTCCQRPSCLRDAFIHSRSRSTLPWRSTFKRHFNRGSSGHPPHLQHPVFSLWRRRTGAYVPASIIVFSMPTLSNSPIHFLWSLPPWKNSGELASSRS